jgi:hypothetical protein
MWNFLIFTSFGAVRKDRNRRTSPDFISGDKKDLTQRNTLFFSPLRLSLYLLITSAVKILDFLDSPYGRGCKKKKIKKLASGVNFQCTICFQNRNGF